MKFIQYAQESIQFQSDEFARALISQCGKILTYKSGRDAQTSKELKDLEKLILDSTGILAKLKFDTSVPPAINIPRLNPNDILQSDFNNSLATCVFDDIIKKLEQPVMDGFVDLKKSRIGGFYSTIKFDIFASFKFITGIKFSAEELAAIILHELGHAFVLFEMLDRTCRTNQILAATAKASSDNPTGDLLKQRIVMIGSKSDFTDEQITALQNANSAATRQVLVLSYRNNEPIRNDLQSTNYHTTTYEALADNFVARHNLGRDLVSALERVGIHYGMPEYHKGIRVVIAVLDLVTSLISTAVGVFMLATGGAMSLFGVFLLGMIGLSLLGSGDNYRDFTYDDLNVRYKRIREQSVVYLKNKQLDPQEIKRCLEDLEFFDSALKKVGSSQGVITKIANMVLPGARKESKAIELQRDLEALAANDLFAKAATLSLLK
jgi:hypothetical protein